MAYNELILTVLTCRLSCLQELEWFSTNLKKRKKNLNVF